jgi:4-nitrophenyl phosphatase
MRQLDLDAFIFDLDGCIYRGDAPIPGAEKTVSTLRGKGKKVLFLTNNSTRTPEGFSEKLRGFGIDVPPSLILTSAGATAIHMRSLEKGRVFVVGEIGLEEALAKEGFEVVGESCAMKAKYVVSGLDRALTYGKVAAACSAIRGGATYIATNEDPVLPHEGGYLPGAGSIVSMIRTATGRRPLVIGKPSRRMVEMALGLLKTGRDRTAMVGDTLDLDIAAAKRARLFSILVLTGVSGREDVEKSRVKPDLILESVRDLIKIT